MHAQFDSILQESEFGSDQPSRAAHVAAVRPLPVNELGRLRILMVVEASAGGTGRHVLDLSEALIERGCEVHLIYSARHTDNLFLDRLASVSSLHHTAVAMRHSLHPLDLASAWAVRGYIRKAGPFDLVHGHSSKGGAFARLAALGTGIPAVYTLHGLIMMDPDLAQWKRIFYQTIEVGLSFRTRRIIAVSPEEYRAAVRVGLGKSRLSMVPNGVGDCRLAPRGDARRAVGVSDDHIVFGFVGRLVSQKAPLVLIDAFAATARAEPRSRLALIGAGPLEGAMRRRAVESGVGEQILWLGERDARAVVAAFDVFVLPSRKEGLPYVVLEAMAAGLPVVATATAGVEILVETGFNGAVVPRDDVAGLAEAMVRLATDPELRARYGRASRKRVSRLTVDAMADGTLAAYRDALEPTVPTEPARSHAADADNGLIAGES
jgi:glycosyltransferase involved in cell wall biosynthesis